MRWPTASIPKGTLLYHGTAGADDFVDLPGPAWVSNAEQVAHWFARRYEASAPRVLIFKARMRISRLVRIEGSDDLDRLVVCLEEHGHDEDIRRDVEELANAVCGVGFNGWHIPHNYPEGSDTMLCQPMEWLEHVETQALGALGRRRLWDF